MLGFLARHRGLLLGAGLSLIAVLLLASGRGGDGLLGRSVGAVGAPFQALARGATDRFGYSIDTYLLLVGAKQEADRLRQEVAELRRELMAVEEVNLENQRLRALLGFKESTDLRMLPARVVGRSGTAWFRSIVIDSGSADGVSADCPVVTPAGVIGRVYRADRNASRVLLLTDPNSAVDAIVQRTRAQVVVEGQLDADCRVLYLARGDEAEAGDQVVTSGLDGVFPHGLLIGEISQVDVRPGQVFHTAELTLSADLSRLEEVFVVFRPPAAAP